MASGYLDRKGHRTLRETPLSDAVDLPDLPLREVDGLPGEGGAHQVRDSFEQLRDMHGFLRRRRERFGPNFAHGYFGFVTFAVGEPELARELLIDRGAGFLEPEWVGTFRSVSCSKGGSCFVISMTIGHSETSCRRHFGRVRCAATSRSSIRSSTVR